MKTILFLSLSPCPFVLIPLSLTDPPGPQYKSSSKKDNLEQLLPEVLGQGCGRPGQSEWAAQLSKQRG